jgi:diaminopimelate decarboxylase
LHRGAHYHAGVRDPAIDAALATLGCADLAELTIGGIAATELVATFGSPLYVFDAAVLRDRVAAVRRALGPRVELLWSVKANPSLAVTSCLRQAGCGAEIASLGELAVARAAGHAALALRFAGPGKRDEDLAGALAAGVGCWHVESADEVDALARLAAAAGTRAGVAVRVNLPHELGGTRLRMGGRSSRFGIDADQVPAVLRQIVAAPSLRLLGLHAYAGTQAFDGTAFVGHAAALLDHAGRWERELGVALAEIDLGGGFGVPAYAGDPSLDLTATGQALQRLLAGHERPGRRWFVELGRYLAAPAGVYLTRVVRQKQSGGVTHVAVDGGMHQHAAACGVGTVIRRPPLLVRATALQAAGGAQVTLGGPLCTPADQFADALPLGPLAGGELLAVLHAGAYGLSFSPHSFLSHATPAEVMVDGGRARLVRARGAVDAALHGQQP